MITVSGVPVRIDLDGMFGIGAGFGYWPGFSAQAVEPNRAFISPTGYRSFLGIAAEPIADLTPESFSVKVVSGHVECHLKEQLVAIEPRYRTRLTNGEGAS